MEKVKLGKSGLMVSRVGLGGLQWGAKGIGIEDEREIKTIINHALDSGINFLDTAESYADGRSEKLIGQVLKERGDREDAVIATKVYPMHLRFDDVLKACHASLRRLQTDYIDLLQIHAPSPNVPVSETMIALRTLLDDGLVKFVGVSNFQVSMCEVAINSLDNHEIISNQVEFSILSREPEKSLLQYSEWREMFLIAYSPLASGLLTGKYDENSTFEEKDRRNRWPLLSNLENRHKIKPLLDVMGEVGQNHDATQAEVAVNWLLHYDNVIPIPGAKSKEHVDSHIKAATWRMSDEEWNSISEASKDLRLNTFYNFGDA